MRKFLLLFIFFGSFVSAGFAQNFSNQGKEFYLCYPNHVVNAINGSPSSVLSIWITSDQASSGTVTMPGGVFSANFNIAANGIQEINVPYSIAHITGAQSNQVIQKSIKISVNAGQAPVVAYAQQYGAARSASTLLLPTNVLSTKYRAISFTQSNGSDNFGQVARSQLQVIATEQNTLVQITPFQDGLVGTPFTISLPNIGDIYQYQTVKDLTGTVVESLPSATGGCKRIAVFSGSSNITFGSTPCAAGANNGSSDPLFQQLYPVSTWGQNFGFVPMGDYTNGNPYRVMADEDNTVVSINGNVVATLSAGQIYPAAFTNVPSTITQASNITATKPITVAQYCQRRDCSGTNNGDPDMVILNPIEQNIKDITIFVSNKENINRQWINVLIPTSKASTFRINGVVPTAPFIAAPNIPGYSTLTERFTPVIANQARLLTADTGFNAICYGFQGGQYESYAYSAGTSVKPRQQGVFTPNVNQQPGFSGSSVVCRNSPFRFKIFLPNKILSNVGATSGQLVDNRFDTMRWNITPSSTSFTPNIFPYTKFGNFPSTIVPDSISGPSQDTAWYFLPGDFLASTPGNYTLTITTKKLNNLGGGCSASNEFDYNLPFTVAGPPAGSFSFNDPGCPANPVIFLETTPQSPPPTSYPTYRFYWNFGEPSSTAANESVVRNPTHTYSAPGNYEVKYIAVNAAGCSSDTISNFVTVPDLANVTVTGSATLCINDPNPYVFFTITGGIAPYTINFTLSNNGGAPVPQTALILNGATFAYAVPTGIAGTFVYNVTSIQNANPAFCIRNITGQTVTFIVKADATINLTSPPNTDAQSLCINNTITNITYSVGGTGTGGSVSGLPAGVTGTFAAGVITIAGTPTVSGTFNYTVSTSGTCVTPDALGTITVTPDATLAISSAAATASQTKCINTALTNITYAVGGSGTGGSVSGLPAGVTGTYNAGVITISGTPTVSGTFNYTVSTTGPCVKPSLTGVINVTQDATLALLSAASTNNQTLCINNAITNITYAVGDSGTGGIVNNLPAGVTGTFISGVITISGTPTVSGTFNYTVNTSGPCVKPSLTGVINVTADAMLALSTSAVTANQTICINTALTNITYAVGSSGTGGSVTGLPAGVTGTYNAGVITISGTPTVSGVFNYTVNTTGPCVKPSLNGVITVTADATLALSSAAATNSQTLCINTLLTNITYAVGGTGTGGSVSGLPAGVTGAFAAGVITISGTPTVSGTFNYTVNTTGPCVKPSLTGTIIVTADATLALSSVAATASQTICINTALANITYAVGGTGTGGSVTGLPAGVTGTYNAGVITISGTPTVSGTFNYTVNTTGPCVKPSLTGVINVTPNATLALSSAAGTNNQNLCINVPITNITYSVGASGNGGSVTGLPAGVTGTYAGGVITISGTPTLVGTFNYTVSTSGPCVKPSTTGVITVTPDATIALTSAAATTRQKLCKNSPLTNITFQIGGGGTGATATGLPSGVTGVYAGGIFTISGTPNIDGFFIYSVNTTGTCVQKAVSDTIVVHPLPTSSYFANAPFCAQNAVLFTPTFGITPIGSVVSWVWNYGDGTGQQIRANGNPFTLTYPTAGVKPVSFKVISDKGCESDLAILPVVSINSKPKAGFKNPESCLADAFADFADTSTVIVGGPIVNWEWDFGDATPIYTGGTTGSVNSHKNPRHAYLTVGLKTVKLIVTTASGCKDTTTQSFFINGEVTSADFLPQGNFCSNRPVKLKENSVVNVGGLIRVDIYWDNANAPTVVETDDFPTPGKIYLHSYPNVQTDRTYSVRYIAYSGFNGVCQKEVTKSIIVHASPVASFTAPINVCLNSGLVPLSGSETGGVGGTTIFIGTGVSSTGIFNPLLVGAGVTDTITFTAISPNGCDSAIKRPIRVLVPPVANFATVGNVCVGGPGNVNVVTFSQSSTVTAGQGGAIVKWIYDWGDGSAPQTFITGGLVTHAYSTAGPKTAYLIVEDAFGCRNAEPGKAFNFTVNPLPVPDYSFTTSACLPNANIVFTNLTPSLGSNSYNWYFELPSTAAANTSTSNGNPTHIYTVLGPHNTKLIATNTTTGCKDSTTVRVVNTIHPAPVVTFGAMLDICLNNGTRLLTQGNQSYPGMIGTGVYSGPGVSASGLFNPLVAGVGTHTLTYTFTSTFNCTSFATSTIKVLAPPVVNSFTTPGFRCERNDIIFENTTTSTAGVVASWIYNWGDASAIQTNPTGANINHQYALAGSYPATLTLVTDYGCNSSPAFPLQVIVNPIPRPNFTYSDTACLPVASILFKNTTPNSGDWLYNWNFDVPSTATLDNSSAVSNITHLYYTQAPHNVRLIATSTTTGCKDSIFKPIITIHPAPNASFGFTKPSVCIGDFVGVIDQSTFADGVGNKWEWKWGDNATSLNPNPGTHIYATATTYNVSLKITNNWGCIDDTIRPFTVHPFPVVNAGRDSVILQGGNLTLTPTVTGNDLSYLWSGTPGPINLNSVIVPNPVASPVEDITYKLTVTARGGCSASDFVFIKVLKDPVVPNTFTPNNDGVHDTWVIKYLESYPDNRIQVFTRAGQLVFESKRYLQPWDGTVNGKSLPIDTYYYILEPGNGRKPLTGFVTIIK